MIYFNDLPLDKEILEALEELKINYIFQSIFQADGKTIFAREALMRPVDMSVMELIEKYTKEDRLHVLEIATFFGAMQEYVLRGYTEHICLNSFPSEYFTMAEAKAFSDYYGDLSGLGIIEILEYPYISKHACNLKRKATKAQRLKIAVDDFGDGLSDMNLVNLLSPDIVKEQAEVQTVPIQCKVALTIKEAAEYSNIGINKLECLLRSPRCPFVLYVGKKKLVKRKEFEKFISDNVEI